MDNFRPPGSLDAALLASLTTTNRPAPQADPDGLGTELEGGLPALLLEAQEGEGPSEEGDSDGDGTGPSGGESAQRSVMLGVLTRAGKGNLSSLVNALASDDREVVMVATIALGNARDSAAVPHLVRLLRHPDLNIAQSAIDALGKLRAAPAAPHIEAMLEADPWLRFAATHALGEIGNPGSVHALLQAAADPALAELAIEALGKVATVPAATILAEILLGRIEGEGFDGCLLALSSALARIVDRTGLDNSRPWQRLASAEANPIHARLVSLLVGREEEPDGAIDQHFLKEAAITLIRSLSLPHLYPALVEAAWDVAVSEPLLDAVVFIGPPIHPHIIEGLAHSDAEVRAFCATAAAALGLEEATGPCAELLGGDDLRVRLAALRALAALGAEHALPAMVRCLAEPAEPLRTAAVAALAGMDANRVTVALLAEPRLAEDHTARVLEVMRGAPCAAQQPFVIDALADPRAEVRRAAVRAQAEHDSAESIELLAPLLHDASVEVRAEVIEALGRHGSRKALALLLEAFERDGESRGCALRAIGRIGDGQAARRLIACYRDHDQGTRLAIIDALGMIAAPASEPFLAEQMHGLEPEVQSRAVVALGRYTSEGAVVRLVQATRDPEARIRLAALESLSGFAGRPAAVEAFERLCLDPIPAIASLARRALGRR